MRNDFKMIVLKQLTISIKTQHYNKINVSCSATWNGEKTNNAPNNVERFKVSTVLVVMFSMCNILLIRVT
jgi:hypothetical protein